MAHVTPPQPPRLLSDAFASFFAVTVVEGTGQTIPNSFHFEQPAILHVHYLDRGMTADNEAEINLYMLDASSLDWAPAACGVVSHDVANNQVDAPICGPGIFGVFVPAPPPTYLPIVTR